MCKKLVFIFILFTYFVRAQIGGRATYEFLNIVSSPKLAALSGVNVSHLQADLEQVFFNPSLMDSSHVHRADLNYTDYLGDINYGFSAYAFKWDKIGYFLAGAKYVHYGNFLEATIEGDIVGNFSAAETAIFIAWSRAYQNNWTLGSSIKFVNSNFYQYNSVGILMDFATTWTASNQLNRFGLVVKNLGKQLTSYSENNFEPLPFQIQAGFTKKLPHAPFQFSITGHQLQHPNLWYDSPNANQGGVLGLAQDTLNKIPWGDVILRHFTLGMDLLLSDNFQLHSGYHHQRRSELRLVSSSRGGPVGFSFGFSMKIKKFHFNYARSVYHLAAASNHFGVSVKVNEFNMGKNSPTTTLNEF